MMRKVYHRYLDGGKSRGVAQSVPFFHVFRMNGHQCNIYTYIYILTVATADFVDE